MKRMSEKRPERPEEFKRAYRAGMKDFRKDSLSEVSGKLQRPDMSCYMLRKAKMIHPGERSSDYNAAKTAAPIGIFGKENSRARRRRLFARNVGHTVNSI